MAATDFSHPNHPVPSRESLSLFSVLAPPPPPSSSPLPPLFHVLCHFFCVFLQAKPFLTFVQFVFAKQPGLPRLLLVGCGCQGCAVRHSMTCSRLRVPWWATCRPARPTVMPAAISPVGNGLPRPLCHPLEHAGPFALCQVLVPCSRDKVAPTRDDRGSSRGYPKGLEWPFKVMGCS